MEGRLSYLKETDLCPQGETLPRSLKKEKRTNPKGIIVCDFSHADRRK